MAYGLLITSCTKKVETISPSNENNHKSSRLYEGLEDDIVDSVYGTFSVGHNYIDEYVIDIYPDNFPVDPIETEVFLGEKNRELAYVELPGGVTMKNCPDNGSNCGCVYWRGDKPNSDPRWTFIGYY